MTRNYFTDIPAASRQAFTSILSVSCPRHAALAHAVFFANQYGKMVCVCEKNSDSIPALTITYNYLQLLTITYNCLQYFHDSQQYKLKYFMERVFEFFEFIIQNHLPIFYNRSYLSLVCSIGIARSRMTHQGRVDFGLGEERQCWAALRSPSCVPHRLPVPNFQTSASGMTVI
jgi:hypothetical protein